mgnify:CR=1 FL=1
MHVQPWVRVAGLAGVFILMVSGEALAQDCPNDCEDGNVCTTDWCDEFGECHNDPADGTPCEDGDACSGPEHLLRW